MRASGKKAIIRMYRNACEWEADRCQEDRQIWAEGKADRRHSYGIRKHGNGELGIVLCKTDQ